MFAGGAHVSTGVAFTTVIETDALEGTYAGLVGRREGHRERLGAGIEDGSRRGRVRKRPLHIDACHGGARIQLRGTERCAVGDVRRRGPRNYRCLFDR